MQTRIAGGKGTGDSLDQFNRPRYMFIDQNYSIMYLSDMYNHRVMKCIKDSKEGIVIAGGQGIENNLTQLSSPPGLIVDHFGNTYVADSENDRIMRFLKDFEEGTIVVGGNGFGTRENQLYRPEDISFDRHSNLHVVDCFNYRVQRFSVDD